MKILLYSKLYNIPGVTKNVGGGLLSAFENQKKMLSRLNIPFTENIEDDWDVIQINIPWPESVKKAKNAKLKKKKVVMWSHVTVEDLEKSIRIFKIIPFLSFFVKKYLKKAYSQADLVLCPSLYTRDLLINYGIPKDKLAVQSNAIDTKKFYKDSAKRNLYRKKYNLSGLVVGTLSLVIPRKGGHTFVNLSNKFVDNQFIWFGKIFHKFFVAGLPKNSKVIFTGYVEDAVAALNAIDIFLFPSHEENQGIVILEAAAVGLPILVRDIPAYNGWLVHDVNCLKAKNEKEFEMYLGQLIKNGDLRSRLGKEALVLAKKEDLESQGMIIRNSYNKLYNKA